MRQVYGMSEDGKTIIVKKFDGNLVFAPLSGAGESVTAMFLDVETTGLDKRYDKIIDLAYIIFEFDKLSRRPIKILKQFSQLEDPGQPLSDIVKRMTGYTDADLQGKVIDWEQVAEDMMRVGVVIAHNAEFDRSFLDRQIAISREKIWACSANQIVWKDKGHASKSLECLAKDHGFFYDAHTALSDVKAAVHLLAMEDPDTKQSYLMELLTHASAKRKIVIAEGSRIEFKDELKKRGYRWNGACWSICVPSHSFEEENFIASHPGAGTAVVEEVRLKDNFKTLF